MKSREVKRNGGKRGFALLAATGCCLFLCGALRLPLQAAEAAATGADRQAETQPEGLYLPAEPNGHTVAVDPGHQAKGNNEKESIGPGAAQTKAKVAGGTRGVSSGVPEYQLTLDVSLLLREELLERGYTVYMIRETNEVNISNKERAELAGEVKADILLRIHADGAASQKARGSSALCPTPDSPYCAALYEDSRRLSDAVLSHMTEVSGAKNRGVTETDAMSGINWSTIPVSIIEMGFMTNPQEDEKLQTAEYQALLAKGMADGVDAYFAAD